MADRYEAHLLGRISDLEAQNYALGAEASALRAQVPSAMSAAQPAPRDYACRFCGYWSADQSQVAGHITHCQRRAARSRALASEAAGRRDRTNLVGDD